MNSVREPGDTWVPAVLPAVLPAGYGGVIRVMLQATENAPGQAYAWYHNKA